MTQYLAGFEMAQPVDEELDRVVKYFDAIEYFERRAGSVLRRALDEVIDGPRTGRWSLDQLEQPEKTYIGTKVEILLRAEFDLPRGGHLDCLIDGIAVDIKFTVGTNWTIPREAINYICLLVRANDARSTYSIGLLRMLDERLNPGKNRDQKRSVGTAGRQAVHWLVQDGSMPENVLLHLAPDVRDRIMSHARSGQARVDELFRLVQDRIIPRQTVAIVAQQQDPMKRGRDARQRLRDEGILVLCGTFKEQQEQARKLGLPMLGANDWISTTFRAYDPNIQT